MSRLIQQGRRGRRGIRGPLTVLIVIYAAVLGADFLAPYPYAEQDRELAWAPPNPPRWVDAEGAFHWRPFVYPWRPHPERFGEYVEDRRQARPLRLFPGGDEGTSGRLFGLEEGQRLTLLGTDGLGRDVFSRLLYGGRVSLVAGLLAALLAAGLGLVLGLVAGFYGGWRDALVVRACEVGLALPWLYLVLALRAFLPLEVPPATAFLLVVTVLGLLGWAPTALLVRGQVRSQRGQEWLLAGRGLGASDGRLLFRHLLPATWPVIVTQICLLIPEYILAEVTLSFLGLGVGEPMPSWGNMLAALQQYHVLVSARWMFLPALALAGVILCFRRLAAVLQDRYSNEP